MQIAILFVNDHSLNNPLIVNRLLYLLKKFEQKLILKFNCLFNLKFGQLQHKLKRKEGFGKKDYQNDSKKGC